MRLAGSRMRITYGTFCLVVSPASSAAVVSPSSPWNGSRAGSRSKRSTSSVPRCEVAITTGRFAARAYSRSSSLISSPSHSSTTTSAPATKSAIVSSSTPRGNSTTRTYGSSSATSRAASTTFATPTSAIPPVIRFRFERSSTSKSASRSSPPIPSCTSVVTTARPTDSPAIAMLSPLSRCCSSSVIA